MVLTLRQDIHFCIANSKAAFLDLRSDRYFCLQPPADGAFQKLVRGEALEDTAITSLKPLIEKRILLDLCTPQSLPTPALCPPVKVSFQDQNTNQCSDWRLLAALTQRVFASNAVRTRPLYAIVAAIRRRKATVRKATSEFESIEAPLRSYLATRQWISTQDQCLRWSVGLVHFLAKFNFYPDLVLGVKMKPFAAHAWVQDGDCVLNDSLDRVRQYTPILVV